MTGKDLIDLLGYKIFKWRGRDKAGCDCFGFFLRCCQKMNMYVPDYVYTENNVEKLLLKEYHKYFRIVKSPRKGDAIIFRGEEIHIGVYLGEKRFIHFSIEDGARVDYLYQKPWTDKFHNYFRYLG